MSETRALTAEEAAAEFEMPMEWARYHAGGWHICVDGRNYSGAVTSGCLVTDRRSEIRDMARRIMARRGGDQ